MIGEIEPFIWIYLVILLVIAQHRGALYDLEKKTQNPNYSESHSFSFKSGRIWFGLPRLVFEKDINRKLKQCANRYNAIVINVWLAVGIIIIFRLVS